MLESITVLMKSGKLKDAAEQLHQYALNIGLNAEVITDIVVLSGNISELIKQEKRRKISTQEALDIKTRYAFELEDIISLLRDTPSPITHSENTAGVNSGPSNQHSPNVNNNINVVVNVSIENIITTEVKNNIQGLAANVNELKNQLKEEAQSEEISAALQEVEELDQTLETLQQAEKKEDLPPMLKKVEDFLKKVETGNDYVSKAFKLTKAGVDTLQKMGKNYNSIAQWLGLPQVPTLFL